MYLLVLICIADSNPLLRTNKLTDIRANEVRDYFQTSPMFKTLTKFQIVTADFGIFYAMQYVLVSCHFHEILQTLTRN
jgi:hypothetical protein